MRSLFPKAGWMIAGVLALYVLSALAGAVTGGPLDPPGAPGPTMRTIDTIPPSWFRLLNSGDGAGDGCGSSRFVCVLGGQGVFDAETGLVWQRDASANAAIWSDAVNYCRDLVIADRKGWRLPTAPELSTLIDMSGTFGRVPDNDPFIGIQMSEASPLDPYWTSTDDAATAGFATVVQFAFGSLQGWPKDGSPSSVALERVWCVRGGPASDG